MDSYSGTVVGVTFEGLKNYLRHKMGTSSWTKAAKNQSRELVAHLDADYGLITQLEADRVASFTLADVLIARSGSRHRAGQSVKRGRKLEDQVEQLAKDLLLPYELRTRFNGSGQSLPCDLAIPAGGEKARIVCAVKGFDSTGSKLTDAVKEIQQLADYRKPTQFVFAVVDGIGWLSRKSDLRALHTLWEHGRIDGLYTMATLSRLRKAISEAADQTKIERLKAS